MRHVVNWLEVRAERVITLEIAHGKVMHMHVIACPDRFDREANDLVVAAHRRAFRNVMRGNLVPGWHGDRCTYFFLDDFGSGGQLNAGYDYVVGRVEADSEIGGLQHWVWLLVGARHRPYRAVPANLDRYFMPVCPL